MCSIINAWGQNNSLPSIQWIIIPPLRWLKDTGSRFSCRSIIYYNLTFEKSLNLSKIQFSLLLLPRKRVHQRRKQGSIGRVNIGF